MVRAHSAAAPPVAITTARARDHPPVVADEAATALLCGPQRVCARALEDGDARLRGRERRELAHDPSPGRAAAGVDDAADRVPALQAEREVPEAVGVEAHAERLQVAHAVGRLADEDLSRRPPYQRAARALGVPQMQLEAVVRGERRREAALRPVARGLGEGVAETSTTLAP